MGDSSNIDNRLETDTLRDVESNIQATEQTSLLGTRQTSTYNSVSFDDSVLGQNVNVGENTLHRRHRIWHPVRSLSSDEFARSQKRHHSHSEDSRSFREKGRRWLHRRNGVYDEDRQAILEENNGIRVWVDDYTTIDWIHDHVKERIRVRKMRQFKGLGAAWRNVWDRSQAWLLVTITGVITACIAALISIVSEWLTDLKNGYCTTNFRFNRKFCCWNHSGNEFCPEWVSWSEATSSTNIDPILVDFFFYIMWAVGLSFMAALMVKYTAEHNTTKSRNLPHKKKISYYAAGSGIPEVKVILGGFVIRGFLGIKTLWVKAIGLCFSVSSGLNTGKEGPLVHVACCVGNIASRIFTKYNKNEGKRREILSASAAAGVAVAFAAPVGGVLFSLEEVSYYFPAKTMIRSYFCALIAAFTLKLIDPFRTGKLVMFQVTYDRDWKFFELAGFLILGIFGGLFGVLFTKVNIGWSRFRRNSWLNSYPVAEVLVVTLVTAVVSFWNPYTRMGLTELASELFNECSPSDDNEGLCVNQISQMWPVVKLLLQTFLIRSILLVFTFGIRVPAGIFLPSLTMGGIAGRLVGLCMQYLTMRFPDSSVFSSCNSSGSCVIPGVYGIVGAAATLAGATRTTVSLVVIMFELTGGLTYVLPIMIAVMIAKWVSDALSPHGIYDELIELNGLPYLDNKHEHIHHKSTIDIVETFVETIDVNEPNTVSQLRTKLARMVDCGYGDSGIPILEGENLVGYIACNELEHALERINTSGDTVLCNFKRGAQYPADPLTDFTPYMDNAPLAVDKNASVELVMELFTKLGLRYLCVVHTGKYVGVIDKKRVLSYLKEFEEH
ncbi:uncharacterized protein VTP21DRAFT_10171 [Calcarisporiella thermophila]|uniref:uncharacterized protein n=1 Tax=Calcarisporiella thermophila TaxID=911321 RepID=UPI0037443B32